MMFDHRFYNQQYLENIRSGNPPIVPDEKYGILIENAIVPEGNSYWKIIGIHHLLPEENMGNHNLFVEALNQNGDRVPPPLYAGWTWEGRRLDEVARPGLLDKPSSEPATNFAMSFGQIISVWILGNTEDGKDFSDTIKNVHTNHPDEPAPDGSLHNSIGHHSFYVVFQQTESAPLPPPPPPPPSTKLIEHYVLIAPQNPEVDFFVATNWAINQSKTIGFNAAEAGLAKRVTVVGKGVDQSIIDEIRNSGSEIEVLTDPYETKRILDQRILNPSFTPEQSSWLSRLKRMLIK